MKKKIILLLLLVVCTVSSLCLLTACNSNGVEFLSVDPVKDAYFGDYDSSVTRYIYFNFKSTATCNFECTFTVIVKNADAGEVLFTEDGKIRGEIKKGEEKRREYYFYVTKEELNDFTGYAEFEVKDVKILKTEIQGANEQYDGYAIGFGVAAAILLVGLVVVFVLDRLY